MPRDIVSLRPSLLSSRWSAKREDYRDAGERLTELKRQKRLADLYAQGLSVFQMGKWSEAIIDLKRVVEIDPNYRDAAQRLQEAQRQDRFQDLYKRGHRVRRGQRLVARD